MFTDSWPQSLKVSIPSKHDKKMTNRLILGTAQLGQAYGIANASGQPDQQEANAIVRTAWDGGIVYFDTAQGYGASESVLGAALRACGAGKAARVITKLVSVLPTNPSSLRASVMRSLTELGIPKIFCLMLHREEQLALLDGWQGAVMEDLLVQGKTDYIGISVYTPEAALQALAHRLVAVVQIPASLFDRRFEAAGVFAAARDMGKELHVRSVFLQGALGMLPEHLPDFLAGLAPALVSLRRIALEVDCSPLQLALVWMLRRHPDQRILFGAEQAAQVRNNLDFAHAAATFSPAVLQRLDAVFPPQLPELLNPALWRR